MWGHMDETITVDSSTFTRPKLASEVASPDGTLTENNEIWARGFQPIRPVPVKVAATPICCHVVPS